MYFQDFPVVPYPYYIGNKRQIALARNILRHVAFSKDINNQAVFLEYSIKDGERPEHIANRIYGNPNDYWAILLANNITDPYHGWYKSQNTMELYIQKKYTGIRVYFADNTSVGFTCDFSFISGCTLSQGTAAEPIVGYRETFCEFTIDSPKFNIGLAVVNRPNGTTAGIYIQKILPSYLGVHHFALNRPNGTQDGSNGAVETLAVDPLTLQSADYEATGVVVGSRIPPSGLAGVTGATVEFWQTYIGKYMGVFGSAVETYAVNNYSYENNENENKRTIKVLSPAYFSIAEKELKNALGV